MPEIKVSDLALSVRYNDKQILLKTEKEKIHDHLMGEDIVVEGNFFIFNCLNINPNDSIIFQLVNLR